VGDPADDASRNHLRSVVDQLRQQHERFCSADEDDDRDLKREVRRARVDLLHEINLLLAQIGEIDMVHELERAPFESKIERLSTYLRTIPRAAHG
jgi:cell division septum initiation protein DivIVA